MTKQYHLNLNGGISDTFFSRKILFEPVWFSESKGIYIIHHMVPLKKALKGKKRLKETVFWYKEVFATAG